MPLFGQLVDLALIHGDFLRPECQGFDKVEIGVSGEGSQDPEEGLFVLVVGFG